MRCVSLQSGLVTIPGKGGRPRKWRSDADRVRAYRARQQGKPEPVELVQALEHGDELAKTWETIRRLGEQLDHARAIEQQLRKDLQSARRDVEQQQRRFGWIEHVNIQLRVERDARQAERDVLASELVALRERVRVLETMTQPLIVEPVPQIVSAPAVQRSLSRAQRRQLEREQQRRRGR